MHILFISTIILLLIGFIISIVLFKNKRLITIIAIFICLIGLLAYLVYHFGFYNNKSSIEVCFNDSTTLALNIKNHQVLYDYTYCRFDCDIAEEQMLKKLQDQYPQTFYDGMLKQFVIVKDNVIYTVEFEKQSNFLWKKRYSYILSCNIISLDGIGDITFPIKAIGEEVEVNSDRMKINCSYEDLIPYYEQFEEVTFVGNEIQINAHNSQYKIAIENNEVFFSKK